MHEQPASGGVAVALQVPRGLDHERPAARLEVVAADRLRVAADVRGDEERTAVRAPDRLVEPRVILVRRHVLGLAGRDVDQIEVVVARPAAVVLDREDAPVGRESGRRADAAAREDAPLAPVAQRPYVDRPVDAVVAVRPVRQQRAVAAERDVAVSEASVVDERPGLRPRVRFEQRQLRQLVAGVVVLEQHRVRSGNEVTRDGVGEVGELLELTAVEPDPKELHRSRQVGADEERAAFDVRRRGGAQLEQVFQVH
jgi:hypothetical protein